MFHGRLRSEILAWPKWGTGRAAAGRHSWHFGQTFKKPPSGVGRDKDVPLMVPWLPRVLQGQGAVPAQPLPQPSTAGLSLLPFGPEG